MTDHALAQLFDNLRKQIGSMFLLHQAAGLETICCLCFEFAQAWEALEIVFIAPIPCPCCRT